MGYFVKQKFIYRFLTGKTRCPQTTGLLKLFRFIGRSMTKLTCGAMLTAATATRFSAFFTTDHRIHGSAEQQDQHRQYDDRCAVFRKPSGHFSLPPYLAFLRRSDGLRNNIYSNPPSTSIAAIKPKICTFPDKALPNWKIISDTA